MVISMRINVPEEAIAHTIRDSSLELLCDLMEIVFHHREPLSVEEADVVRQWFRAIGAYAVGKRVNAE